MPEREPALNGGEGEGDDEPPRRADWTHVVRLGIVAAVVIVTIVVTGQAESGVLAGSVFVPSLR